MCMRVLGGMGGGERPQASSSRWRGQQPEDVMSRHGNYKAITITTSKIGGSRRNSALSLWTRHHCYRSESEGPGGAPTTQET